jgi:RNA polymerase sigma-70 factor, ECF subfamily
VTTASPEARRIDDDAGLVAAAQAGDRKAMDNLLRRHYDRIHAICRRITANDADALDATQEAMIAVVRGLPRFDGNSLFSTWVYRVATNASLDELRRRKRRPDPVSFLERPNPDGPRIGEVAAGSGRMLGGVQRVTDLDLDEQLSLQVDIEAALGKLPPEFRAAVTLRDLCGLDYAEIGEILGIPGGTVRSRISRGRAALLPLLGNSPEDIDRPSPDYE